MAEERLEFSAPALGAGDLLVTARALVEGLYQGRHQSPQRGAAAEFYDFRAHNPGESVGAIDWRIYARTDRHYVRRRRHEAQLDVTLVVDASASMGFAALEAPARRGRDSRNLPTKLRRASELAASIAVLTVRQGDRIRLLTVGGAPSFGETPFGAGRAHLHRIVRAIEDLEPHGEAGLTTGLGAAAKTGRGGLTIAIGDALEDVNVLLEALARLRRGGGRTFTGAGRRAGGDAALIAVLSPDELDLSGLDAARLVDPETGASIEARGEESASAYAADLRRHLDQLRGGVEGMGARFALSSTGEGAVGALRSLFASERRGGA